MNTRCLSLSWRMTLCSALLMSLFACGGGSPTSDVQNDPLALSSEDTVTTDAKKSPKPAPAPKPSPSPTPTPVPEPEPEPVPPPSTSPSPVDTTPIVPASFFGMHIAGQLHEGWPTVPFATQRIWDSWPGVSWNDIHTGPGRFNWTQLDALVADSERFGVELVYTFGYTPRWASSNPNGDCSGALAGICYAPSAEAWREFVTAITARYRNRIKYWEIWNEPNAGNFWKGTHAQMADMSRQASPIIRNANGVVLSPAPQGSSSHRWLDDHFTAAGTSYVDVVTFHGYLYGAPELITGVVADIRAVQAKHGIGNKPLWDTEHSWGDVTWPMGATEDQQSAWLARFLPMSYSAGIARTFWYGWEHFDWGTLFDRRAKRLTKAGIAHREVHNWMEGSRFSPCTNTNTVYECRIKRDNGYEAVMVWNSNGSSNYVIPAGYTRLRTIEATQQTLNAGQAITVGMKPVLIEKLR